VNLSTTIRTEQKKYNFFFFKKLNQIPAVRVSLMQQSFLLSLGWQISFVYTAPDAVQRRGKNAQNMELDERKNNTLVLVREEHSFRSEY
jgi:hypothetical protein